MRLELTGRHLAVSTATRKAVEQRIAPVLRKLSDRAVSAHVVLTQQKTRVHAEVTLHARGVHFLHSDAFAPDAVVALGRAAAKIERQAETLKGKMTSRKGGSRVASVAPPLPREAPPGPRIIRTRRYAVRPMSIEDAAAVVGDSGDAVLVFRNASTGGLTILFRRTDGNLGLIEPDA